MKDQITKRIEAALKRAADKTAEKPSDPLLTRHEVAKRLRYSVRSIDGLIERGELATVKFAHKRLVKQSSVTEFIDKHDSALQGQS